MDKILGTIVGLCFTTMCFGSGVVTYDRVMLNSTSGTADTPTGRASITYTATTNVTRFSSSISATDMSLSNGTTMSSLASSIASTKINVINLSNSVNSAIGSFSNTTVSTLSSLSTSVNHIVNSTTNSINISIVGASTTFSILGNTMSPISTGYINISQSAVDKTQDFDFDLVFYSSNTYSDKYTLWRATGNFLTTATTGSNASGTTTLNIVDESGFAQYDGVIVTDISNTHTELHRVFATSAGVLRFESPLRYTYSAGSLVSKANDWLGLNCYDSTGNNKLWGRVITTGAISGTIKATIRTRQ